MTGSGITATDTLGESLLTRMQNTSADPELSIGSSSFLVELQGLRDGQTASDASIMNILPPDSLKELLPTNAVGTKVRFPQKGRTPFCLALRYKTMSFSALK